MTALGRRPARLEHLLTAPNASLRDLDAAVALVLEHDLVSCLTVGPWLVKPAKRKLGRSRVRLATVVGYGHGGQLLSVKAFEASKALEQGATQIDFVINGGALVSGEEETVYNDMLAVVDMAHSALATSGAIIEVETLPADLVGKACRLAERAGVDRVVTSSGSGTAKRTIALTALLRDSVGPRVSVTASGRIREASDAVAAIDAGASRVAAVLNPAMIVAIGETLNAGPAVAGTRQG